MTRDRFERQYCWAVQHLALGTSISKLARTAAVNKSVVKAGLEAFMGRLPSDFALGFHATATRAAIERAISRRRTLGGLREIDAKRRRQDLRLVGWLGVRWRMAAADIARLVVGLTVDIHRPAAPERNGGPRRAGYPRGGPRARPRGRTGWAEGEGADATNRRDPNRYGPGKTTPTGALGQTNEAHSADEGTWHEAREYRAARGLFGGRR